MKVWVDVDNPPQTRYLLPLARRFEEVGHDVLITARDYGDTLAILEADQVDFEPIGSSFGKGVRRKLSGLAGRARELRRFARSQSEVPQLVLTGSRSGALAARMLRVQSFVIVDYEYVDLSVFLFAGTNIVHPSLIDESRFRRRGISARRLLPFDGLKEDISFSGVDIAAISPHDFGPREGTTRILFRPPAEESHYHRSESRELALSVLQYLRTHEVQVVFSPRFDWQVEYLEIAGPWRQEPIVLREPIPTVPLLKAVDAVVSAGGTMLREAAYVGVPAYSIFRSRIGAVDRHLASMGRLSIVASSHDFPRIISRQRESLGPLLPKPGIVEQLEKMIIAREGRGRHLTAKSIGFRPKPRRR